MADYDLIYPGLRIDDVLETAYELQQQGYIFRGVASEFSGTPTERTWLITGEGSTGYGFTTAVPKGCVGICLFNGSTWSGKVVRVVTLDAAPTSGSTNAVQSGAVYSMVNTIATSISNALDSLTFQETTVSGDEGIKLVQSLLMTSQGVTDILTSFTILAATTSKAGLLSASDKAKLDAILTNIRSMVVTDTTLTPNQGTELTESLKWTVGGVQEVISAFTILAATTSKAGLMSAEDKTKLNTLFADGYKFAGIAVPSTVPMSTDAKIFYIATQAGNYASFDNIDLTNGINVLMYSGSAWSSAQIIGIDKSPKADSHNFVESGGVYNWVRSIGSKANSIYNGYFLDLNHVFSGTYYTYTSSQLYDTAWVCLQQGASQVTITGATPFRIRYFSSLDVLNESTNISYNTTGVVPTGAKLALVAFLKSSNPSGYDNLVISQDNLVDMMSDNLPKGLYMHKNHIMSINHTEQTFRYVFDKDWDCFHVVLGGEEKINISGFSGNYRFFDTMDVFTGENVYTNLIETNSTGVIPEGAVMCTISVNKENYPNGYGDFRLVRTWPDNKDDIRTSNLLVNKGFYIDYNHVLSINMANEAIYYYGLSTFDCAIINVEGCSSVILHGVTSDQNYRFFNSTDILDGGSGTNIYDKHVGVNKSGVVPEGAVICVCSMRKTDYPDGYNDFYLERQYNNGGSGQGTKKKIRMLLIGNSATDDALSYVPFIMQNMGVDVDFQIGIAMMSSSTLEDHLDNFENETAAYSFRLYTEGSSWQNFASKTIQWMLDNYQWDIVSLQQAQPQKTNTYQPYLNQLINLISGYVDYPIKFIWYQTHIFSAKNNGGAPRSEATITEYYEAEAAYTQSILENTLCEYVVPVSTAIQNARGIITLKTIGDYANNPNNTTGFGYLNANDGVHLQEGLPCQIAAYTFIMSILDIYGFKEYSINGENTRVTAEWTQWKNIPSPHGDPVGSTDANCLMAQKCVVMAMKNKFQVTDMSYIINPT